MKNMGKRFLLGISCLMLVGAFSGCATNRATVQVRIPTENVIAESNGEKIFIDTVFDQRQFQDNPPEANIPSLGFGGVGAASEDIKKRAVARKRNSYGKALGDILLEEGQTVEGVVRGALERAFLEMGYEVIDVNDGDSIVLDAEIDQFWAYVRSGFWTIALTLEVETKLLATMPNGDQNKDISVKYERKFQTATEGNWMKAIDGGVQKFIDTVKEEVMADGSWN
jgi:uncharacterized lipoprotein YajG